VFWEKIKLNFWHITSRKVTHQANQNTQTFQACFSVFHVQSKEVTADTKVTPYRALITTYWSALASPRTTHQARIYAKFSAHKHHWQFWKAHAVSRLIIPQYYPGNRQQWWKHGNSYVYNKTTDQRRQYSSHKRRGCTNPGTGSLGYCAQLWLTLVGLQWGGSYICGKLVYPWHKAYGAQLQTAV